MSTSRLDLEALKAELRTRGSEPDDVMGDADCFQAALSAIELLESHAAVLQEQRDDEHSGKKKWQQRARDMQAKVAELEKRALPDEPDIALLASMATCANHAFGMMDAETQERELYEMRKLYDEVAGKGYYRPEYRERYTQWLKVTEITYGK